MSTRQPSTSHLLRTTTVVLALVLTACGAADIGPPALADYLTIAPMTAEAGFEFTGQLDGVDSEALIIDGRLVPVDAETELAPDLAIGQLVEVELVAPAEGGLLAIEVEPASEAAGMGEFELKGSVQSSSGSEWVVGGISLSLSEDTEVDPDILDGSVVSVEGHIGPDGQFIVIKINGPDDHDHEEDELESEDELEEVEEEDEAEDSEVQNCEAEEEEEAEDEADEDESEELDEDESEELEDEDEEDDGDECGDEDDEDEGEDGDEQDEEGDKDNEEEDD